MTISELEGRFLDRVPGIMGVRTHYAVLVPVVEWNGKLHLLFEVRSDALRRQPGEVCFPGGRMEEGETPTQCALRETCEELAIPPSAIRPMARLDDVFMPSHGRMHPVLAQVDTGAVVHMKASAAEVKETFLVPADFFQEQPPLLYNFPMEPKVDADFPYDLIGFPDGYPWRGGTHQVPIWTYKGHAIWGLTARILLWNFTDRGQNSPAAGSL